jgi:3-isopropylmalate/(R)-2-methylmalate dehydratase large subunit
MAKTFFEKVWSDHVIKDLGDNSALLQIDRLFLHDLSGSHALRQMEESGRKLMSADQVFAVVDHVIDTRPGRTPTQTHLKAGAEMMEGVRRRAPQFGIRLFDVTDPRQGIVHVISPELGIALPGTTLVCGDSHTCTVGGVGALAWGVGFTEGEHVLATQTLTQTKPKTMRVNFEGALGAGVYPKDMVLHLIGTIGANGGIGYAVEFAGSTIRSMPVEGRLTICNMTIEFTAKYGFVPADDVTFAFLKGREYAPKGEAWDLAVAYWRSLATDPGAVFDREVTIDCTAISPQVTWGSSPQQVVAIDGATPNPAATPDAAERQFIERGLDYMQLGAGMPLEGVRIEAAYIGSCTNSRLSDLRAAAAVLKGRKVAPGIQAICVPGSSQVKRDAEAEGIDEIFKAAGFEWHESGCAMCANMGNERLANIRVISTTNRNFEGRQGPRTRTHLASPATVAASAVAGRIADVRKLVA